MKRVWSLWLCALIFAMMLSGCGGGTKEDSVSSDGTELPENQVVDTDQTEDQTEDMESAEDMGGDIAAEAGTEEEAFESFAIKLYDVEGNYLEDANIKLKNSIDLRQQMEGRGSTITLDSIEENEDTEVPDSIYTLYLIDVYRLLQSEEKNDLYISMYDTVALEQKELMMSGEDLYQFFVTLYGQEYLDELAGSDIMGPIRLGPGFYVDYDITWEELKEKLESRGMDLSEIIIPTAEEPVSKYNNLFDESGMMISEVLNLELIYQDGNVALRKMEISLIGNEDVVEGVPCWTYDSTLERLSQIYEIEVRGDEHNRQFWYQIGDQISVCVEGTRMTIEHTEFEQ